jgi:hypothetical protein
VKSAQFGPEGRMIAVRTGEIDALSEQKPESLSGVLFWFPLFSYTFRVRTYEKEFSFA